MTEIQGHHADGCLMCAVRALTEGRAKEWQTEEPGEVTGVVLRMGNQPSAFTPKVPFIELWLGGQERVRLAGHAGVLASLLENAELQVGDTVTVRYLGKRESKATPSQTRTGRAPNQYKAFELSVERGH